jgi:predicted RND superfamily exporter protein
MSVLGLMSLLGWKLGVSESLAIVILIGFSIDYVVHLAAHYVHSPYHGRYERMKDSYREMGVSIFAGAITTAGSGAFLFPSTSVIFWKFAVILTSTIGFALFYSMMSFGAIMHICGIEGNFGSIYACFAYCCQSDEGIEEEDEKGID